MEQNVISVKKLWDTYYKGGEGSGDLPGHPFRGNQWTEGQGGAADAREIKTDEEGYGWHEKGYARQWAESLSNDELRLIQSYTGFSYASINGILRGEMPMREEKRDATDAERDRLIANGYNSIDLGDGKTLQLGGLHAVVRWDVVDEQRVKENLETAQKLDSLIEKNGLPIREGLLVSRAGYIPGMSPEDFEALVGKSFVEKGFTSTFLGPAQGRATGTGYITYGIAESKYRRYDRDVYRQEVGTAVRFKIALPEGTKVISAEAARRLRTYGDASRRGKDLDDPNYRSESEIIIGSGARYKILSVERKEDLSVDGEKGPTKTPFVEVTAVYAGGGASHPRSTP